MSDILKEIYIKQAQRQKAAGTESEKIASLNAAYAQAQKVKKQRQINDQRQKAGALQVRSIEQGTAAKGALQKATEEISLAQEQRDARYNLYMDLTSKGIYDPNAAAALGVSKKTYDRVLAKVQAARAPKITAKATNDVVVEENEQEQEPFDPQNVTYSQQQAANRRAMNDDVDGDGQRGAKKVPVEDLLSLTMNPHEAALAAKVAEQTASAKTVNEMKVVPSKEEADAAVEKLKSGGFYVHSMVEQKMAKAQEVKKLSTDYGFDSSTSTTISALQGLTSRYETEEVMTTLLRHKKIDTDPYTYTQNLLAEYVITAEQGKKRALKTEEKAMLILMKESSNLTAEGKEMIDSVLAHDLKAAVEEYRKRCKEMSDEELQAEVEASSQTDIYDGYAAGIVIEELEKREAAIWKDEAQKVLGILIKYSQDKSEETITARINYTIFGKESNELTKLITANNINAVIVGLEQKLKGPLSAATRAKYESELETLCAVEPLILEYYSESEKKRKEFAEKGAVSVGKLTSYWQIHTNQKEATMMGDPNNPNSYMGGVNSLGYDKTDYWNRDAKIAGFSFSYNDLTQTEQDIVNYLLGKYPESVSQDFRASEGVFKYLNSIEGRVMRRLNIDKTASSKLSAILKQFGSGVEDSIKNTMYNLAQFESGTYAGTRASNAQYQWQNAIEENNIGKLGKGIGEVLYSFGQQMPRQVISGLYGPAGRIIGDIVFGSTFALSAWNEKKAAGWSDTEAATYTIFGTAFQVVTEHIEDILDTGKIGTIAGALEDATNKLVKSGLGRSIIKLLIHSGGESLEELVQGIGDYAIESAITNGQPESELDWSQLLYDAVIGFGVGLMGGSANAVLNLSTEAENDRARRYAGKSDQLLAKATKKYGKYVTAEFWTAHTMAGQGYALNEVMQYAREQNYTLSPGDVKKIYAAGKGSFIHSMSESAEKAYRHATGLDVQKQSAWLTYYNVGERGEKVSSFEGSDLTPAQAKAAYDFGIEQGDAIRTKVIDLKNKMQAAQKAAPENRETSGNAAAFDVDSDELARRLTIAGRNGLEIEEVYDGEITDTMRAIYNEGKRADGDIGTTTVTVNKGSGTLRDKTGGRYNPQLNIEQLRRFAKVTGIDVEIAPDGSVDGKAAFEVGAFKILVSESATMGDFMHEVLESMAALSAEDFNHVSKMLVRHFLDHNHTLEELDDGIAQKMVDYNTKSYPFARKEWVCDYAGRLLSSGDGLEVFLGWLDQHDKSGRAKKSLAEFIKALWEKLKAMCRGDWIGTAEKRRGQKLTDELQGIIDGLENTRTRLASLENGQTVEVGGGEGIVRNHLPFYSMKEKDVNRIGWAEELFSDEDKLLLNDRFVDIMIHKDLGDAVRLKGGSYLLDVNNKIVIIGGSFKNPVIHFVMVINTGNATNAQEIKEVIFTHEHLKSLTAREASSGISIYETYFGQEVVRGYHSQDFGYNAQSANLYARLPEGFRSYGYTGTQRDGSGVSAEDGGTGELRYSLDTTATAEETEAAKRALPSADTQMIGKLTAEMDELSRGGGENEVRYAKTGQMETDEEIYQRRGWARVVLSGAEMEAVRKKVAEAGPMGYNSFINIVDSSGQLQGYAFELNNKIVIINSDFEFYAIETVIKFDNDSDVGIDLILSKLKEVIKYGNESRNEKRTIQGFIETVRCRTGVEVSETFERQDYRSVGDNGFEQGYSDNGTYRIAKQNSGYLREVSNRGGSGKATGNLSKRTENDLRSLNAQYIYAEKESTVREALEETARIKGAYCVDKKPVVFYYATNDADIDVLDTVESAYGDGVYVSTDGSDFGTAGEHKIPLFAFVTKPFKMKLTRPLAEKVLDKYVYSGQNISKKSELYNDAVAELKDPAAVFSALKKYAEANGVKVSDILKFLGFDSVRDGDKWVIFDPRALKSAETYTFYKDGTLVDLSERFDPKNKRLRFSKSATATAEETEAVKRTLPSADAQMIGKLTAEMDELARNSGKLPQGERVKRDIAVPRKVNGKKTMLWARTFFESGVGAPEMVDPVSAEVLAQGLSYKVVGDKAAIRSAESALSADGYEAAIEKFIEAADLMEQGNGGFNLKSGKVTVAKGQLLLRAAAERKDYHNFKRLVVILSEIETLAGQVVQAASMLKKMGGEVKLFEVKRTVDRINRELSQGKYGKSGADMKISIEDTVDRYNRDLAGGRYGEKNTGRIITVKPELIDQLIAAGNDGDAANKIVVEIYKDIAKQLPSSFADKWNTWRYLAMLFNPTTHFRNILSNAIFTLPLEIKNTLQWAIEAGIGIFRTETERSATVGWSKRAMEFAKQDALEMELSLKSGGKYNEQDIIDQYRDRFKSRWLKWIDGGSRFNSALLEKEDWWFLKGHYARALARYITANKLDADNMTVEQLTRARDHAMKQAQKATFRDASQFANAISAFSKAHPVANVLAESVMPFKKTPINILKRGMEYSPLGLISTLSYGSVQLARGKVSANEYIGQLAAGLTGSMIVYLGFILAKLGLLQGGLGRDDEDRENRAKDKLLRLEGAQEFSLVIGDHMYTLDWMAPASIPLFIGVELYDAFADNDKKLMDKVIDALLDGTDVIVNTSMLSGLEGFVDALKYDDNVVLGALGNTAVNYVSQGFPTLAGRITSTIDGKRRVNYIDKTSWAPEILQELGNKFFTKFWPWAKPVYYDEFGREDQNTNVFGRFLENFFSPGYYSKIKSGDLEEVMQEIYEATDEPTPIPTTAAKSFKVNGETRQLKAKEYETFSKNRGQIAYDIMKDTIKSDAFKKMDAESQAKVLKEVYTYANAIAKTKAVNCDLEDVITNATKWIAGAEEIKGKIPVADIIVYRQLISEDSLGSGKRMDVVQALRKAGMSEQNAFDYVGKIRSGYAGETGGTDYAVSDIYLSLKNGGTSYEMIYKDLLEAYRERGKTEKEARSIIRTGLTRLFKADYLAASPSERKEIVAMLNKSGVYGTKSDVSDTVVDWYNESLENK